MRCGKKQCYLESLWTFRYNKDIASEKTLKSGEKKGVTMDIIAKISEELGIRKNQAEAAVKLIDEGEHCGIKYRPARTNHNVKRKRFSHAIRT